MEVTLETISQSVVNIKLTIEEANKLVGLLDVVPTKDEFFSELAANIDAQHGELPPGYAVDADGDYVVTQEY